MDKERIAKMAENIVAQDEIVPNEPTAVAPDDDDALGNVDQALISMLAALQIIDENLPKVKADSVPQRAALDAAKDLVDTAIKPYMADILKVMQVFGT
jgi:hypothetical protein